MSNKEFKSPKERRAALKKILTGTGAVTIAANAPEKWTKPVIDSVILPAHAQSSPPQTPLVYGRMNFSVSAPSDLLDTLVPSAYAQDLWNLCITFTDSSLTTYDAGLWTDADNIWLAIAGTVGVQTDFDCGANVGSSITLSNASSNGVDYYITTTAEGPILQGTATPMGCSPPATVCPD